MSQNCRANLIKMLLSTNNLLLFVHTFTQSTKLTNLTEKEIQMKLRVEKRKPSMLDLTVYETEHPAFPKRKQPALKLNKKQPVASVSSPPSSKSNFARDTFTEHVFDENTKCALCAGDRNMVRYCNICVIVSLVMM